MLTSISRHKRSRPAWFFAMLAAVTGIGIAPASAAAVPGAPKITAAVAAKQGATLTFTRPASDGGARILDYRVTCTSTDGGATVKRTTAKSPISITGMAVKRHYTCVVAARNAVGIGPASKTSSTIVPLSASDESVPPAPTSVSARGDVQSIFVTFARVVSPPNVQKLFVNRYRAKCSSSNGGVTHREERSWTIPGIEVKHLTAGKTYRCTVSARNSYGWGPVSAPSNAVVPLLSGTKPAAPKITSATPIVGGLSIAFVSRGDGGAPILGYRIWCTSTNGGANVFRSNLGARSPARVIGLTAGKTYTCKLYAVNAVGVSTNSAPSHPAVPLAS